SFMLFRLAAALTLSALLCPEVAGATGVKEGTLRVPLSTSRRPRSHARSQATSELAALLSDRGQLQLQQLGSGTGGFSNASVALAAPSRGPEPWVPQAVWASALSSEVQVALHDQFDLIYMATALVGTPQ
ncbi:unnamed protein product, partial [Polarella glacialis]